MSEYQPMETAPKNVSIIGHYEDGDIEIQWADRRQCMLAGVGGGNGYFGAGWEDCENHLIVDTPLGWKPA